METNNRYIVQVYVGALSALYEALSVEASKQTTSEEIVSCIVERLSLNESPGGNYELAEVVGDAIGQECKERRIMPNESPVQLMMLWPKTSALNTTCYRFYLREKLNDFVWNDNFTMDPQLIKDYFNRFLYQPKDREYPDLCQLPDLNEQTLLDNLRARFLAGHIYTYVGSILIAVNPFKFHPIYNPKYVKLYQNRRLGPNLPPHIFAVADTAYHCMLKDRKNQCIVISGESGSGKTESTNFLLHHLTALSQKGSHGSGVEQTILSAGPVLEAFGNAKTAHNNNSSRFGKFIQVNYKENGMVYGAVVQKYLLEKSRICSQGRNERNYHVFYYLLAGASDFERQALHLSKIDEYNYLNRSGCYFLDNIDENYEFSRLKQSMEMVGFSPEKQRRLFSVLSAVLLLGNVEFHPRKSTYHHDEAVGVKNPETVQLISNLLRVKQETLLAALTAKKARASGEILVINYRLPEAIASRDAMAKCLYGALFDWIVLQVNHALLAKKDTLREHQGNSIGVLDIFGFEDFGSCNSFEQLCINYANEHLQYYFNQHVFKYEQEEYRKEGIRWNNIDFMDNTGCLQLIEGKPNGLLCVLDDQCNFPGATSETLLQKFNSVHKSNDFYIKPQKLEAAFMVFHYAGKVKYQVAEMREKNLDLMRQDIVGVLKNSSMAFVRELVGADPVAVFRWAIVRAFFRAFFAFQDSGKRFRAGKTEGNKNNVIGHRFRNHVPNESLISKQRTSILPNRINRFNETETAGNNHHRVSWPQIYYQRRMFGINPSFDKGYDEKNIKDVLSSTEGPSTAVFERVLCPSEARVMQKANQIVMKNKSFRPRERNKKGLKNLQTVKTLAGRTGLSTSNQNQINKGLKKPLTVAAQFQQSLHSLMDTLNKANPFFIRCIKSNSNKIPNQFDEETIQRQLRYTGMLETVRIRQAGFNVRLTYDEFIQLYRILLPKGLLSSQADVRHFLATLNLNRDNYQLGQTKIFFRESEKMKLDCKLHQQIMASIVTIQRWFKVCLERRKFLKLRTSVMKLQSFWRMCAAQKTLHIMRNRVLAVVHIQAVWRGYRVRKWVRMILQGVKVFQAFARGALARRRFAELKRRALSKPKQLQHNNELLPSADLFMKSTQNAAILRNRDSSQEDLVQKFLEKERNSQDSYESNEILRVVDSETVQNRLGLRPTQSLPSVVTDFPLRMSLSQQLPHQQYYRVEDTKSEGVLLDASVQKRKLSKTPNTTDLSENRSLIFIPDSKAPETDLPTYFSQLPFKPAVDRTSSVNITPRIRDVQRNDGLIYLPPVRRDPVGRKLDVDKKIEIPAVPLRTIRKPRRELLCRSMGEETTDSVDTKNMVLLGTIRENNLQASNLDSSKFSESELRDADFKTKRSRNSNANLDLRRRNSDPATKIDQIPGKLAPGTDIEWMTRTSFTIAGHYFSKVQRFSKGDSCVYCHQEMDAFVTQGHKCAYCKKLFHTKCIQNKSVLEMPCESARRKYRKQHTLAPGGQFSLTGTSEFTDRTDKIISDARELQLMQDFITRKIYKMESEEGDKPSEVDRVFKQALREFKDNLVATYSVVNKQDFESFNIKYKDLIANFLQVMKTVCLQEQKEEDFPVTMGVNAFRGFMNEFMTSRSESDKPKTKRKKEKKRKVEDPILFSGHSFILTIINIPTACEICNSFFMWPIERGLICQSCKLTCHKKCYGKTTISCGKYSNANDTKKVFGVPLVALLTDEKIPVVLDRLITTIEMHGLYTEGIYRKSGVSSKVRELKNKMEESNQEDINFEDYQMHVLASVLKSFLREMPEPLLTFDCYEDFLRAASLTDPLDRISTLFEILRKLPKANFDLMERLIFHLARVALHEDINRMSVSALAIVFAPCILRTNKILPAQDSLNDIGRQTQCIETILLEQLRKLRSTLADIDTLDTACHTATNRLSSLRSSKIFSPEEIQPQVLPQREDEEAILVGHIQEIQKEKELLTSALPSLTRTTSDDDMLSTDLEGSLDDISCSEAESHPKKSRVVRSISGENPRQFPVKLQRQSSSDFQSSSNIPVEEIEDAPIMV